MRYCKHTQWLGLQLSDGEVFLQGTDRLQTLLHDLPEPDVQCPSLIVCIGNKSKGLAIKELANTFSPFPSYEDKGGSQNDGTSEPAKLLGRRGHGEIHLHIHASSIFSDRPVLVAEGDLPVSDKSRALTAEGCHETISRQLQPRDPNSSLLGQSSDEIYFKLLTPFTDVICFFATDIGGFESIVRRLAAWLDMGLPSTLPLSTRPKLLIVIEGDQARESEALDIFSERLAQETPLTLSEQFSGIHILGLLPRKDVSDAARHRKLKEHLLTLSDEVRRARIDTRSLLSATHFAAFFNEAFDHLAAIPVEPFSFINASRVENPVLPDLENHLINFLDKIEIPDTVLDFAIPTIASSIILDNYYSGMPFFDPRDVFRTLYKAICLKVCRTGVLVHDDSKYMLLPSHFLKLLEKDFVKQFEELVSASEISSTTWHSKTISRFNDQWSSMKSYETCLMCLRRRPQYGLSCGHCICEYCVMAFSSQIEPWTFTVTRCLLCNQALPEMRISVKPNTATTRLLSIDGGGARGIIPLVFLRALEERIGLPYPVQENFDFAYGTSSGMYSSLTQKILLKLFLGGIIILALFINGWPVEDCIDHFERFAKVAFYRRETSYFRLLLRLKAILVSLITDGIYPARNIETALLEVFGRDKNILDYSRASAIGAKIGITVSTMKPEPFLFTNYNGLGSRQSSNFERYGVLLGSAPVWEMVFKTKYMVGFGKFQDGGLQHNNPMKLALEEIKVLNAMDPSAKNASLKVSLGTGKGASSGPQMHGSNSWWKDLWAIRLCRALWSSMGGHEENEHDLRDQESFRLQRNPTKPHSRRGEYFRFNVEFGGQGPRLDDVSRMKELKALAEESIEHSNPKQLDHLARCIIAELFYFELESVPRKENGRYSCSGHVFCRLRAGTPAFDSLLAQLTKASARFTLRTRILPGAIRDRSSLEKDGNFRKTVRFEVTAREDQISLCLWTEGSKPVGISGSPFSLNWLIKAQGLEHSFGGATVGKRKGCDLHDARPRKRARM
ncbi:Calcium-independent phospholipase A2-gamma [Lachnellula suecica]|uniref:Calcium-independent phospholipase A2-gamma n=1 Tax=Lachnellula suecica TaxID=602035 RepID=A0A8T9CK79_9HELO|nr:Calcium-independent phospholipase A2-gamma [Lachnellula suecica]